MEIGVSLLLMALGAILLFGPTPNGVGISFDVLGAILLVIGIGGLLASFSARGRAGSRDDHVASGR